MNEGIGVKGIVTDHDLPLVGNMGGCSIELPGHGRPFSVILFAADDAIRAKGQDQALYYAKAHGRNQAVRVLAGPARPETPEQAEKLLKNLEYGEQKGYIIKKVFRTSGGESSCPEAPG